MWWDWLFNWFRKPAKTFRWRVWYHHRVFYGVNHMAFTLSSIEKVSLMIQPVNAKGNPAPIDGVPVWTISDPTVATLTVADDGLTASLVAINPGSVQITVQADADLGPGTKLITGTLDVTVTAAEAVAINIIPGVAELQ